MIHTKDIFQTYNRVRSLVVKVFGESPSVPLWYGDIRIDAYWHNDTYDIYEFYVNLDLIDEKTSIEDLIEFNILNFAFTCNNKFVFHIPIEHIAKEFTCKTLFAYAIALHACKLNPYLHASTYVSSIINAIYGHLCKINEIRPTLFAKLFVDNADEFINIMYVSNTPALSLFMQRMFKENMKIDRSLFGTVLSKFSAKMVDANKISQHLY